MRQNYNSTGAYRIGRKVVEGHEQQRTMGKLQIYFSMTQVNLHDIPLDGRKLNEKLLLEKVLKKKKALQTTISESLKNNSDGPTRMMTEQSTFQQINTDRSFGSAEKEEEMTQNTFQQRSHRKTRKFQKLASISSLPSLRKTSKLPVQTNDLLCITTRMLSNNVMEVYKQQPNVASISSSKNAIGERLEASQSKKIACELPSVTEPHFKYQVKTPRADFLAKFPSNHFVEGVEKTAIISDVATMHANTVEIIDMPLSTQAESPAPNHLDGLRKLKTFLSLKNKHVLGSVIDSQQFQSNQPTGNIIIPEDDNSYASFTADFNPAFKLSRNSDDHFARTYLSGKNSIDSKVSKPNVIRFPNDRLGKSFQENIGANIAGPNLFLNQASISGFNHQVIARTDAKGWRNGPDSLRRISEPKLNYKLKEGLEALGQSYNQFYKPSQDEIGITAAHKELIFRKVMSMMQMSYSAEEIEAIEPEILERIITQHSRKLFLTEA
jgi:hypothetical protein